MDGDEKIYPPKDNMNKEQSANSSAGMKKLVDYDSSATSCSEVFNEEVLGDIEPQPEVESFSVVSSVVQEETPFMNTQLASRSEVYISVPMTIRRENYLVEMNLNQFSALPSQLFQSPYANRSEEDKESTKGDEGCVPVSQNTFYIVDKENFQPSPCEEEKDAQSAQGNLKSPDMEFRSPTATGRRWRSNIGKEFRVPSQVGVRDDGTFVTDFPFDNPKYSPEEKKDMSQSTRRTLGLTRRRSLKLKPKQRSQALQLSALEDYQGKGLTPPKNASSSFEEDSSASDYFNTSVSTIPDAGDEISTDTGQQYEDIQNSGTIGDLDLASDVQAEQTSRGVCEHSEGNESYSAVGALDVSLDVEPDKVDTVSQLQVSDPCKVIVINSNLIDDVAIGKHDKDMSDDEEIDVLNCSSEANYDEQSDNRSNPDDDEEFVNGYCSSVGTPGNMNSSEGAHSFEDDQEAVNEHDATELKNDTSETESLASASHTTFTSHPIDDSMDSESDSDGTTSESSNSTATNDNPDDRCIQDEPEAHCSVVVTADMNNRTDAEVLETVNEMAMKSSAGAHSSEDIADDTANTAEVSESSKELSGESSVVFTSENMKKSVDSSENITEAGMSTVIADDSDGVNEMRASSSSELTGESSAVFTAGHLNTDTMEHTSVISEDVAEPSIDVIVISSDTIANSSIADKSEMQTVVTEKEQSVNDSDSESLSGNSEEVEEEARKDHSYALRNITNADECQVKQEDEISQNQDESIIGTITMESQADSTKQDESVGASTLVSQVSSETCNDSIPVVSSDFPSNTSTTSSSTNSQLPSLPSIHSEGKINIHMTSVDSDKSEVNDSVAKFSDRASDSIMEEMDSGIADHASDSMIGETDTPIPNKLEETITSSQTVAESCGADAAQVLPADVKPSTSKIPDEKTMIPDADAMGENQSPQANINQDVYRFPEFDKIKDIEDDESDVEYNIDEKFQEVIDRPTQGYRLIELRDLVRHLDRFWLSNEKSRMSIFRAVLRQIDAPPTFTDGHLRTMVLTYIKKFTEDVKKLVAKNLKARNMTVVDLMNKIQSKVFDGGEMTLMIMSQMFGVPIAVYHPEYIWLSHRDKTIEDCPLVLLFDCTGTWHPTVRNYGKLLRLNDKINFSLFAPEEEKKKFVFSRKKAAKDSPSVKEEVQQSAPSNHDTTDKSEEEESDADNHNVKMESDADPNTQAENTQGRSAVKTKAELKQRLQAAKKQYSLRNRECVPDTNSGSKGRTNKKPATKPNKTNQSDLGSKGGKGHSKPKKKSTDSDLQPQSAIGKTKPKKNDGTDVASQSSKRRTKGNKKHVTDSGSKSPKATTKPKKKSTVSTPSRNLRSRDKDKQKADSSHDSDGSTDTNPNDSKLSGKRKRTDPAEWVDPNIYPTKRIKHEPVVKSEPIDDADGSIIFCTKCNKVFLSVDDLQKHEKSCYKGRRYNCFFQGCDKSFSQRSIMHQHYKGVHQRNPFRCPHCNAPYIFTKVMNHHIKTEHKNDDVKWKYNCTRCTFHTDNKSEFQIHTDRHDDIKRYVCGKCEHRTFSQSQLTLHMNSCISGITYDCDECGATYQQKSYLKKHFHDTHVEGKGVLYDDICIRIFKYKQQYKKHMKKEHNVVL